MTLTALIIYDADNMQTRRVHTDFFRAGGRRPDASAGRPSQTLLAKSGRDLGGWEGATQQQKRIFCYEMYFKHDLPHDEG